VAASTPARLICAVPIEPSYDPSVASNIMSAK
jgi:hypothetical protein